MDDQFQQKLIDARRQIILDAAIDVIVEQGFQRTTIKQIARKAGVADGTIYNYFKNKDAILFAIVERLTEAELRELHFGEAQQIPYDTFVEAYIAHRMNEVAEQFDAMKIVFAETIVNATLQQRVNDQIYAPAFEVAERYFQHLMAEGVIGEGDPQLMTRLFAALPLGVTLLRMLGDQHVRDNWADYSAAIATLLSNAESLTGANHDQANESH